MICNFSEQCNSLSCIHKRPHTQMEKWCEQGSCKWSSECRCVPESKRERVEDMLKDFFAGQNIPEIADRIEEIYKEGTA